MLLCTYTSALCSGLPILIEKAVRANAMPYIFIIIKFNWLYIKSKVAHIHFCDKKYVCFILPAILYYTKVDMFKISCY